MRLAEAWFLGCLLALPLQAAQAQSGDARDWLERMSEALASSNYDGLFTHSTPGQTESMRIVHRVEKGRSLERLQCIEGGKVARHGVM